MFDKRNWNGEQSQAAASQESSFDSSPSEYKLHNLYSVFGLAYRKHLFICVLSLKSFIFSFIFSQNAAGLRFN